MAGADHDIVERLRALDGQVRAAVDHRRSTDPNPDDAFRGLYVSEEQADSLLTERLAGAPMVTGGELGSSPTGRLAERFGLDALDLDLLTVALAPDLDPRFEKLYGYLHDDITRRRASVGLAIELVGHDVTDATARKRLSAAGALVTAGLVEIEDPDRPFLTRALRVPDRVIANVLGDDTPDPELAEVRIDPGTRRGGPVDEVARAVQSPPAFVYLHERLDAGGAAIAAAAFERSGRQAIAVDLSRVHPADARATTNAAVREARLVGGGLIVGPVDTLEPWLIRLLGVAPVPRVLFGTERWDPARADVSPLVFELDSLGSDEQIELWREFLTTTDFEGQPPLDMLVSAFRLGPGQIARAVEAGRAAARAQNEALGTGHLRSGARHQNAAGLEQLARRVVPSVGWGDIILDEPTRDTLKQLTDRVAFRTMVLDEWGLRRGGGRGEGITALFAGDSGTGKTLAAEVVAGALGLEMYVIDLSTVVDKYVGETEKNLERVFSEAEGVNAVLFFDEADALFGKRSEVSDARDRYANVEVAYLLQRMESFDGLAVLASNLKANIDEAFARRLSVVVDFPEPDPEMRLRLWDVLLGSVPRADDLDLAYCAEHFELTGGNIRNVAVTASYLAAANGGRVETSHLIRAVGIEYRKLGRLTLESEFGPYLDLIRAPRTEQHHGT